MRLAYLVLLPLVTLILAGCGGGGDDEGGGDGGGNADQPSVTPTYTLTYPTLAPYYEMDTAIADVLPSTNASALTNFTVSPNLPGGLFINKLNGKITGKPVGEWMPEDFTISAEGAGGVKVSGKITFGVTQIGQTSVDPASTTPRNFSYDTVELTAYVRENIKPLTPRYQGDLQAYFGAQSGVPYGMYVDMATGVVTGAPAYDGDYDMILETGPAFFGFHYYTVVKLHVEVAPLVGLHYPVSSAIYAAGTYIDLYPGFDRGESTSFAISPALPAGLTFNTTNGRITGSVASTKAAQTYTVTATNSVNSTTGTLTLEIGDYAPTALRYTKNVPRYIQNVAIESNQPFNDGGVVTSYSVSPALPAGLSFNTTTGVITGTPTTLQAASNYVITATNASGSVALTMPIAVVNAGTSTYYTGDGVSLKAYAIDDVNGDATYLNHSITSSVTSHLVFHPTYNCMVGYTGGSVESYSVDKSQQGALTSVTSVGGVSSPAGIVESGDYIFVANSGFVSSYSIDSSCALTFIASVSSLSGARDMVMQGSNIYVLNDGVNTQHFRHTGSGVLTTTGSIAMQPHANPGVSGSILGQGLTVGVSSDGSNVYAFDSQRAFETYAVDASTGALSRVGVNVTGDRFYFRRGFMIGDYIFQPFQAQNDGIATFKMVSGGLNATSLLQGTTEVGNRFAGATRISAHTSVGGTYVFAEYSNIARTGCSRLKLDVATGSLTPVDGCLVGILGGY